MQTQKVLNQVDAFVLQIKSRSDKLMNYFLVSFFIVGLLLAFFYDTWEVAIGVGTLSLAAYYSVKMFLPSSDLYQYVLSSVFAVFMAQFIYQMHGMFEMHFIAFVGSTILVTYQNWKLQIPLAALVVLHHATFGYLQYLGYSEIYFTQLDYMTLQTFIIHGILATAIFFICGLWAYQLRKYSQMHIAQTFEMGRLLEEHAQKLALEKSNAELRKINNELDSFVYSVSHDLRAPLSSMLGIIGICEASTTDPFMIKNIGMLKTSVKKSDGFIRDILDYSRNSRLALETQEIHFDEIVSDISENLKFMGNGQQHGNVQIRSTISNGVPFYSDKYRLNIIFNNLISNGIRYHNPDVENPYVEVLVDISDNTANIIVRDNGIGIAPENHEKIFDMFYRVSKKSVGSGLGLYIVKEAVAKLHGTMDIISEPGKGTEFNISIPNSNS